MSSPFRCSSFVVFEGIDCAGKTTQARALVDALTNAGVPAVYMRFPDRETPIGKLIDAYLRGDNEVNDRAIHLLFSANRWECEKTILAHCEAGMTVVCDRYTRSGQAYSMAKGLSDEWCAAPDHGLLQPGLTIMLELAPEEAATRSTYGDERYETTAFQTRVLGAYERLLANDDYVLRVDATKPAAEQTELVLQKVLHMVATEQ